MYPDYNKDDIATLVESDDEDSLYVRCKFKMDAIHKKIFEVFGTTEGLETYDVERRKWRPLVDLNEWSHFMGGAEPMLLRIPAYYDDTSVDEAYPSASMNNGPISNMIPGYSDDEEDIYDSLKSTKPVILADTIRELVRTLKAAGYERCSTEAPQTMRNAHGDIVTRDWILHQAGGNPNVASVILGHIGALDHIVECITIAFGSIEAKKQSLW